MTILEGTHAIQNLYIGIQDAMLELEGMPNTEAAMECLEIANKYCKAIMKELEDKQMAVRQPDHYYYFMGVENPRRSVQ